jgi:DNA-binding Lrp family transcriptional regulator
MSKATNIPVSTIFDRIRTFERDVIKKHTVIMDFKNLGYDLHVQLLFRVPKEQRARFRRFLVASPHVNTVFRVNNGYDFLVDGVFKDMDELSTFTERAEEHGAEEKQDFFVLEDVKRESFLATPYLFDTPAENT